MKIIEEQYAWQGGNFKTNTPNTIVIHHALSPKCTAQEIHKWHLDRGWQGFAYHFFIRKDGSIYRGRPENKRGGHLLADENINTIGICLEGCYEDYVQSGIVITEKTVPAAQMASLIELCKDIQTRWTIKAYKRHADYPSAKGKTCPGSYFPWVYFLKEVGKVSFWEERAVAFVKSFQSAFGLKEDGKAGIDTNAKLEDVKKAMIEMNQMKADIKAAKTALIKY